MKKNRRIIIIIAAILVALYLLNLFVKYYGDWLWFNNLNYASVFNTMIIAHNFFEFLDYLFDEPNDEAGGVNHYQW